MSWDVRIEPPETETFPFEDNVTYNVSTMLKRAGLHPEILNGMTAHKAKPVVHYAYELMADNPEYFKRFDATNGWGTYGTTLAFVQRMHEYLQEAPANYIVRWR
jgi:hypothetical protein